MKYSLPANNLYGSKAVMLDIPDAWDTSIYEYAGVHEPAMTEDAIADDIGRDVPLKLAVYPYACCGYYSEKGNVEKTSPTTSLL